MCGGGGKLQTGSLFAHTLMAEMTAPPPTLLGGPNMHVPLVNSTLQLLCSGLGFYFGAAWTHKELSPNLFMVVRCLKWSGAHTSRYPHSETVEADLKDQMAAVSLFRSKKENKNTLVNGVLLSHVGWN